MMLGSSKTNGWGLFPLRNGSTDSSFDPFALPCRLRNCAVAGAFRLRCVAGVWTGKPIATAASLQSLAPLFCNHFCCTFQSIWGIRNVAESRASSSAESHPAAAPRSVL